MSWWYNTESGKIADYGGPVGDTQQFLQQVSGAVGLGAGWHQLPIPASDTLAQAQAYVKLHYPTGAAPTTSDSKAAGQSLSQETGIPSLTDVFTFFKALGSANLWIRAAKIVVGGALLIVAVSHATGIDGAVARTARKVPVTL